MSLEIRETQNKKELHQFIDFPHDLYEGDSYYVPEIFMAQKDLLNKNKHPFHKQGEVTCFLAFDNEIIVGRIAAIKNPGYNAYHHSNIGFFGFYDYIESAQVAKALLDRVKSHLASEKYDTLMGPVNFSTNETAATLVDGFDSSPLIMMTYNKSYYDRIQKEIGLEKEMDLYAYYMPTASVSQKSVKMYDLILERLKRKGITLRNISIKNIKAEADGMHKVYNKAWEKNWGFVPMSRTEMDFMISELKMIADERFCYIAEHNGEAIGFSISLPDINEISKGFKKGRLFPFNVFKLLLKKKSVSKVRIITMGVIAEYRRLGIEALFFARNIMTAQEIGLHGGEASWILESNAEMIASAEKLNAKRYKTYRIYKYDLS